MDKDEIESQVILIGILIDAIGYCDEQSSEIITELAERKLEALKQSDHPCVAFLQAHMPQVGMTSENCDERYNRLVKQSSDAGCPEAQYRLGCQIWEAGQFEAAVNLYKASAETGFPPSQYCYGLGLLIGEGVEKDEEKGLHLIELAAHRLYDLALEFLIGRLDGDLSVDGKKKLKLYKTMLKWSEEKH